MPPLLRSAIRMARQLGLKYNGIQKGLKATRTSPGVKDMHLFTDSKTGSTLAVKKLDELSGKVASSRKKFGVGAAAGGAVGVGAVSQPEEAEAFPIGKIIKGTAKVLTGKTSSTTSRIAGSVIRGQTVKSVIKPKTGDWRYVVFENGEQLPITKDVLNDLVRSVGETKKLKEFATKSLAERGAQAKISLGRRAQSSGSLGKTQQTREFKEASMERLRQLDPALVPDTVFVRFGGETLFMPRAYAELLEKDGTVKILKGLPKVGKRPFKNP